MDALKAEMAIIHSNQDRITQQLAQLLSFSHSATATATAVILKDISLFPHFPFGHLGHCLFSIRGVGVRFGIGLFFCVF